jgi:hypothetical protein
MDAGLLRKWLGLPPGPWPPGDREVLGLADGPADPATVELRALAQMDRLRPHQLRHPELVTEGMNRLAQAMIALTAGGAAPALPPKPRKHAKRKPKSVPILPDDLALSEPAAVLPEVVVAAPAPVILDAEIVTVPAAEPEPAPAVALDPGEPVPVPEPPPPGTVYVPSDRRAAYRELVDLRRLMRTWDRLRTTLAVPGEPFATPAKVLLLLEAADDIRASSNQTFPIISGRDVVAVLRHPLPLGLIRSLVPSQRLAVARDWAQAAADLQYQYETLRQGLRRSVPRRGTNRVVRGFGRWLKANPEWLLTLAVLGLLVLGFARNRLGS